MGDRRRGVRGASFGWFLGRLSAAPGRRAADFVAADEGGYSVFPLPP
ncbi:hypothetical protein V7R84_11895 [Arachnia propionica]